MSKNNKLKLNILPPVDVYMVRVHATAYSWLWGMHEELSHYFVCVHPTDRTCELAARKRSVNVDRSKHESACSFLWTLAAS